MHGVGRVALAGDDLAGGDLEPLALLREMIGMLGMPSTLVSHSRSDWSRCRVAR